MDIITAAGRALWGERWQSEMARATGRSIRTVQRWAAGTSAPHRSVYDDLIAIAADRIAGLGELVKRLQSH